MTKTHLVLGLFFAAVLTVACSSGGSALVTLSISGTCGPLPVNLDNLPSLSLSGPCNLGPAGQYTLAADVEITDLGACGNTPVSIDADFAQGTTSEIASTFSGTAQIPCDGGVLDFSQPILLGGTFTYDGGTGIFADAVGSAFADGGVALSETTAPSTASLSLNGSLTY